MDYMYHSKNFEIYNYVTENVIKVYDYRGVVDEVTSHKSMTEAAQYCLDNNFDSTLEERLTLLKLQEEQ